MSVWKVKGDSHKEHNIGKWKHSVNSAVSHTCYETLLCHKASEVRSKSHESADPPRSQVNWKHSKVHPSYEQRNQTMNI